MQVPAGYWKKIETLLHKNIYHEIKIWGTKCICPKYIKTLKKTKTINRNNCYYHPCFFLCSQTKGVRAMRYAATLSYKLDSGFVKWVELLCWIWSNVFIFQSGPRAAYNHQCDCGVHEQWFLCTVGAFKSV